MRRMRATEKQSHSRQILAPTFQLLGNLQICSQLRGGKKCYRVGERRLQDRSAGLAGEQTPAEIWAFCQSASWSTRLEFALILNLYLHCICVCIFICICIFNMEESWALCQQVSWRSCLTCPGFLTAVAPQYHSVKCVNSVNQPKCEIVNCEILNCEHTRQ